MFVDRAARSVARGARLLTQLAIILSLACFASSSSRADTQVTVVNPQPGDTISSGVSVDTTGAGTTFKANYLLNGTCHLADAVNITITHMIGMSTHTDVNNQPATVKNGVWEYNWAFAVGLSGAYTITVTPSANGVTPAGATVTLGVTLDSTDPGLALWLSPSSVIPQVFAGKGATLGGTLILGLNVRFLTGVSTPYLFNTNINGPNSNIKSTSITVANATGSKAFNNDVSGGNDLPISFALGTAGGLTDGLTTLTIDAGSTKFPRSLIVDVTPPVIDTTLIAKPITYPKPQTVHFSGIVHDPDNGTGAATIPGGIASVELVVQATAASKVDHIPAHLQYGGNPSDQVTWSLDYSTVGKPAGHYSIYAVVTDKAGNQTIDNNGGTPYDVVIDQVDLPSAAITAPTAGAYIRQTVPVTFTATPNADNIPIATVEVTDTFNGVISEVVPPTAFPPGPINYVTTNATDGLHTLTVTVTDAQQNSFSTSENVTIDNVAPTAAFTAPTAASVVSGAAVTVSARILDDVIAATNMVTVQIKDDAGHTIFGPTATANTSAGGFNVSGTWNTTAGVSDGNHTLTLTATDQAGNAITTTLTVAVDNSTPVITLVSPTPAANAWVRKTVAIKANIADTFVDSRNIIHWEIKDGATLLASGDTANTASPVVASLSWDTTATADGNQTLTFTAKNVGGNSATTVTRTFQVDNTPPAPTITSLTLANLTTATPSGGVINTIISGTVTVNFVPNELNVDTTKSSVRIDGQNIPTNWTTHTATWATNSPGDGPHTITVFEKDLAGNDNGGSMPSVVVTVDNTPPVVNIEHPLSNTTATIGDVVIASVADIHVASTASVTFTLAGSVSPPLPPVSQTISVPVNPVTGLITGTTIPGLVAGVSAANRSMSITVAGTDTAVPANTGSATVTNIAIVNSTFGLDYVQFPTQPLPGYNPDPIATITGVASPPAKLFIRNKISVFGRVSVPNLDHWTLVLNGGTTVQIGGNPGPGAPAVSTTSVLDSPDPFDTRGLPDGEYTLTLSAFGPQPLSTLLAQNPFNVVIDNTPPVVGVAALAPFVKGIQLLNGLAADSDSDPLNVVSSEFVIDGVDLPAPPGFLTGGAPTVSWDTSTVSEGKHTVSLYARDSAGNLSAPATFTTTVDRTPPTISINSPPANTIVKGTVTVAVNISDNIVDPANLLTYTITVDGTPLTPSPASPSAGPINASATWNTTTVTDGVHTIQVTATDQAGNVSTPVSIKVAVDNSSLKVALTAPTPASGSFLTLSNNTIQGSISDLVVSAPFADNLVQWTITDNGSTLGANTFDTSHPSAVSAPFPVTLSTSEGLHVLQIVGTDTVGNKKLDTRTVLVDHTPPAAQIAFPANNSYVTSMNSTNTAPVPIPISFTVSDNITSITSGSLTFTNKIAYALFITNAAGTVVGTGTGNVTYTGTPVPVTFNWNPGSSAPNGNYKLTIVTQDTAGNNTNLPPAGQQTTNAVSTFILVNGFTTASLSLTSPAAVDEFGEPFTNLTSTNTNGTVVSKPSVANPLAPNNGVIYVASAFTLSSTVLNSSLFSLSLPPENRQLAGQQTISYSESNAYSSPGLSAVQLTASQVGVQSTPRGASVALLNVVADGTAPGVTIQAPGVNFVAVPSSLMGIVFRVAKPNQSPTQNAPILRIKSITLPNGTVVNQLLNAPAVTMQIFDDALNETVPQTWSLGVAIISPDLTTANGEASVVGDSFDGYTVTWQIKIAPKQFSAGRRYRIEISAASDVVGNKQAGKAIAYFTVNVN